MKSEKKIWKIEYQIPDLPDSLIEAGYNPLLSYILSIKGIHTCEEAQNIFFNDISCIHNPFTIKDMDRAVSRIHLAIERKEKVAVYGDYDVDGITSTCLLTDYLRSKDLEVTPYIPDRNEEGYGLNCSALDTFKSLGISLVITVDCGITATVEAEYASKLGIDMIITDHHECKTDEVPTAWAVIDCKQDGDNYENPNLAGVGVAFKVACACEGDLQAILDRYSDLVAIGTIADVMALTGENRYLVISGLQKLRTDPRPGLAAMMRLAGVDSASVSASSIGFAIAPRLNAAGRLGNAISAGELIMTTDSRKALELASHLCELNKERQKIENDIWSEANRIIASDPPTAPIVLASDKWHQGVIGIAASRLADQYGLPTIMINLNEGMGKGSCRSYGGFNLYDALSACSEHLVSFGGHALAAGLNIREEKIDDFRIAIADYYLNNMPELQPEVVCDLLITDSSLLSVDNVRSLDSLEPYGNSNPRPILCILGVPADAIQDVGSGRHLKFHISDNGRFFDCIFFGHNSRELRIHSGDIVDIAFTPQINEFRGRTSVQLQICALRLHDPDDLCRNIIENPVACRKAASRFTPERNDFVRVWKGLGSDFQLGNDEKQIISSCPEDISPEKYCICLEVFREAGLLSGNTSIYGSVMEPVSGKKDLDSTPLMKALHSF